MGNTHAVNAAEGTESSSAWKSFTNKVFGSSSGDESINSGQTATSPFDILKTSQIELGGAGDNNAKEVASSNDLDPRTIEFSLPTFPGSWKEIHKVQELATLPFDGVRATFNKGLSHHFQVSHNFSLATTQRSGYKFGATYVGTKQLSQSESFPVLTGEIDPSGNLTAQCLHAFTKNTRSRLVVQHQDGHMQAVELGTDYRGPKATLALTAANPDLLAQTGIYIAHGLYAVTSNLAFGLEGLVQRGLHPALGKVATQFSGSVVARYNVESYNAALQISPLELGVHASYYHKLTSSQAVGVELEGRGATGECNTTVSYSFDIPGADCVVKASADTGLNIIASVEKKLTPLPMALTLCCQANQKKSQYLAGIGVTAG
ncbi:mitochondrial import receptor subunit TOM40 homolog [Watersipora subatra]|uniref:mitochondrial import receptor subunit TOM40 homolog n=1 Tax=Watersipora subatra TaxID=2589382 RepID=UPI00355BCBC5